MTKNEKCQPMKNVKKILNDHLTDKKLISKSKGLSTLVHMYESLAREGATTTQFSCVAQVFKKNGFAVHHNKNHWKICL